MIELVADARVFIEALDDVIERPVLASRWIRSSRARVVFSVAKTIAADVWSVFNRIISR
jgi:hypothetical protein